MGLGKFILVITVIIIAVYFLSPTIFQSGYSQVQSLFKQFNITLPMIPVYNGTIWNNTCNPNWNCGSWSVCSNGQQTRICNDSNSCGNTNIPIISQVCNNISYSNSTKASSFGQVYVYLATTPGSGMTQIELDRFILSFKNYLYEASYGYLDNMNFITELNANDINPNIDKSLIGPKIKGAHYLTPSFNGNSMVYWIQTYNSNIAWTFSAAVRNAQFPWSFTNYGGKLSNNGCAQLYNDGSSGDVCRETAHEMAHAIFSCEDGTGDIMRCTTEYPCTYPGHFPPTCLNSMKNYMPQLAVK